MIEKWKRAKVQAERIKPRIVFGTMIGWVGLCWWALGPQAGVLGAIVAFIIGAILCIFVGLTYAELTPALPLAGGELVFAYRGMGYKASWICAWAICFAYVGVSAWEGIAVATAINYVLPIPDKGFLWTIAGYDVYFS